MTINTTQTYRPVQVPHPTNVQPTNDEAQPPAEDGSNKLIGQKLLDVARPLDSLPEHFQQGLERIGLRGTADGRSPTEIRHLLLMSAHSGSNFGLHALEGRRLMEQDKGAALDNYQTLYQPMADNFSNHFQDALDPAFGLQDIISNLQAGRPAAQLPDGDQHPDASQINTFVDQYQGHLQTMADTMDTIDAMPQLLHEWMDNQANVQRVIQQVYERYGFEPWQQTNASTAFSSRFSEEGFYDFDTYSVGYQNMTANEYKAFLAGEAEKVTKSLQDSLDSILEGAGSGAPTISLQQVVDNFRWGRPLGTLASGGQHPLADQIEEVFSDASIRSLMGDYLQSEWLRGGATTTGTVMEVQQVSTTTSTAGLFELLNEDHAVLSDNILSALLMGGKNYSSDS